MRKTPKDEEFLSEIKSAGEYKFTREKAHSSIEKRKYYQWNTYNGCRKKVDGKV